MNLPPWVHPFKSGWTCNQIAQKSNNWNSGNYSRYCDKAFDDMLFD